MNKRGQFFLIAAIVIIAVVIGLAAQYSYTNVPPEDTVIYDLSKEINFEAGRVIDSGIFYSKSKKEKTGNIENITDYYAFANPGNDFIVIYGDRIEMTVLFYTTSATGTVGVNVGSSLSQDYITDVRKYNATFTPPANENTVTVIIEEDIVHTFEIKPGQTFFVIVQKEKLGERYVSASQPSVEPTSGFVCGNSICDPGEDYLNCEADCGSCPAGHTEDSGNCIAEIKNVVLDGEIYHNPYPVSMDTSSTELRMIYSSGAIPYLSFVEWDTSEIPDNANLISVHFRYNGTYQDHPAQKNDEIKALLNSQPSQSTIDDISAEARSTTEAAYHSRGGDFVRLGMNTVVFIQSQERILADLQGKISSGEDWFAIGLLPTPDCSSGCTAAISSSESGEDTTPTLIVTYSLP